MFIKVVKMTYKLTGNSKSNGMTRFDRSYRSSYEHSIVTMALSCSLVVFKRYNNFLAKSTCYMLHLYWMPQWKLPRRYFGTLFNSAKNSNAKHWK